MSTEITAEVRAEWRADAQVRAQWDANGNEPWDIVLALLDALEAAEERYQEADQSSYFKGQRINDLEAALARVEALANHMASRGCDSDYTTHPHYADSLGSAVCPGCLSHDLRAALAEPATKEERSAERDEWCREEACRYRHWTSGSMPTHRRGDDCPTPPASTKETE